MADQIRTGALGWDDLRYFVALAEAGSLSATARGLRVNHATVARRISHLETTLGWKLFDRRAGGYLLTDKGRTVLEHAVTMRQASLDILRGLDHGSSLSGSVRVTTTHGLTDGFLACRLGGLRTAHPDISITLLADPRVASLENREADIAVRLGRPSDGASRGRRVGCLRYGFFGARGSDISQHQKETRLIGYGDESEAIPEARWLRARFPAAHFVFRSNSQMSQAEATAAGLGVALLPTYISRRYPNLSLVDLGALPMPRDIWILIRSDLHHVPRVRVVADYLANLFKDGAFDSRAVSPNA